VEAQRRQVQRARVWQRTAGKRAARQVETELAIQEREDRQRRYRDDDDVFLIRGHDEAEAVTTDLGRHVAALDALLAAALSAPPDVSFAALRRPSDAGPWAWLRLPGGWLPDWVPGVRAARARARVRAFAEEQAVDVLEAGYRARDRDAVEAYAGVVLGARSWPDGFDPSWRLRYRPGSRQLDVEYELPGPHGTAVPGAESRRRYADVVAQIVLCVLVDLYRALGPDVVDVIRLNARVSADGERADRPHLVSLAVTRERWTSSGLAGDPQGTLRALHALVSPDPYGLVPVRPVAVFQARVS
jgi:hypothetical protein